jgi:hypothetical protein
MQRVLCDGLGAEATHFVDQESNSATQGGVSGGD